MAFKFIAFTTLLAVTQAGILTPAARLAYSSPLAQAGILAPAANLAYSAPIAQPGFLAPTARLAYSAPIAQTGILAPAARLDSSSPAAVVAHPAPLAYTAAPVTKIAAAPLAVATDEYDPHPQYGYGYDIQDSLTGDIKSHQEVRDGDVVQGSYSLNDADGFRRTVDYTADPINGFNAVVRREPLVQNAIVAKTIAPVSTYAAPITKVYH